MRRRRSSRAGRGTTGVLALLALLAPLTVAVVWWLTGGSPACGPVLRDPRFDALTVHHTASDSRSGGRAVDVEVIAGWHRARGIGHGYTDERACAYHFVVLPDGTVQAGRPLADANSGTRSAEDRRKSLAVVLVGDFEPEHNRGRYEPSRPTAAQDRALRGIALWAFDEYGFGPDRVRGHGEVSSSSCPGSRMDMTALREALRRARSSGEDGVEPPGADLRRR